MKKYIQWRPISEFSEEHLVSGDRILGRWGDKTAPGEVILHDGKFLDWHLMVERPTLSHFALFRCDP